MTPDPTDFIRALRSITLSEDHKAHMREALSRYADFHTIPDAAPTVAAPWYALFLQSRTMYAGALSLVLVIGVATQGAFAATGSLPGDLLYPLKVSVSEPIALALSLSPERKAELSAQFAVRRLAEAEVLSEEGKLDDGSADQLATRFEKHLDVLTKETEALEAQGDHATVVAVRTDIAQHVAVHTHAAQPEMAMARSMSMKMAADVATTESESPKDRFTSRIAARSSLFTTSDDVHAATITIAASMAPLQDEPASSATVLSEDTAATVTSRLFLVGEGTASSTATTSTSSAKSMPSSRTLRLPQPSFTPFSR